MSDIREMPGHLARRFQQIAVAVFHSEVGGAGYDLTPVQYAALSAISQDPGVDQITLAGLIAYDRTTIMGVIDRLVQKGLVLREPSKKDRRARQLHPTETGRQVVHDFEPAVLSAQAIMLRGLDPAESAELMRLLAKAIAASNELSRAPMKARPVGAGTAAI